MAVINAEVTRVPSALPDDDGNVLVTWKCGVWADNDTLEFRNTNSVWLFSHTTDKGTEVAFDAKNEDATNKKVTYTFAGGPASGVTEARGLAMIREFQQ